MFYTHFLSNYYVNILVFYVYLVHFLVISMSTCWLLVSASWKISCLQMWHPLEISFIIYLFYCYYQEIIATEINALYEG